MTGVDAESAAEGGDPDSRVAGLVGDRGLASVLVDFAHTLGTDFSVQKILDHLVVRIVDILPVTGAGVMLMGTGGELHFIAASNEVVTLIEGLQNELHEGPCLEAYRTGEPVAVTDLSVDTRFPAFSPRAAASGLAAVFTFPMRLGAAQLGAVDLYRDSPGSLSVGDLQTAQVLADVAAAYLFNAQARVDTSAMVARLHHRSLHDPLTGLPNRALLEELLDRAVARGRRSQHTAAVLFADLDGFKSVNDRYGHQVGDQLLHAVASRLTTILRPGDTLARLGGDEFVVLCEDLTDPGDAELVADRLAAALQMPFDLHGQDVTVSASVGIAFSGPGQDMPAVLLRDADFAMYQAKRAGGGHHRVIDPAARVAAERRDDLERDLRDARHHGQLSLVYQPIFDVPRATLVAVEALLRWRHPQRGLVMPDVIIPAAERNGLIIDIGEWVLRQACQDLVAWKVAGRSVPAVAVNVSADQVTGAAFALTVRRVLTDTGVDPEAVCLELTESLFLADTPRVLEVLGELKDLGVRLALDDFGTGYSPMSYLRQFPFDTVKIDRTFTANVPTDQATHIIVASMIDLSHALNLTVVAEGVETADELTAITRLGADHVQGFHLGHPVTADRIQN